MQLRCSAGECKAAKVGASEQPCLEYTHVLFRSHEWAPARSQVLARERVALGLRHVPLRSRKWALARSPVLARERVPLELVHVPSRRLLPPLGLPAVHGGQQVPGLGGIRQELREAPPMNTSSILVSNKLRSVMRSHEMKTSFFGARRHESSKREREDTCCFNLTKNH